jgi:hypothetical protein
MRELLISAAWCVDACIKTSMSILVHAGKTTLMDVICGRKTVGRTTGHLLVNGQPIVKSSWSRVVGYVEQMDVHTPAQTVIEALWFSGRLRLSPKVSDQQVRATAQGMCIACCWGRCQQLMQQALRVAISASSAYCGAAPFFLSNVLYRAAWACACRCAPMWSRSSTLWT